MAFRLWCALALSAICLMVVVGTAQADGDGRADLRGTWRGAITGAAPRITVQLRMGAVDRIRFRGGIRCAGVLEYLGRRGATCVRLGIVHLTPRADGSLRYTWRAGQERARAILRRP
jgi:hypothetical protein